MRNAAEFYRMEQLRGMVENKTPKELLMVTFAELINNLKKIKLAIDKKDIEVKSLLVNKTNDIIQLGLISSLNEKINPQLVESLFTFYVESVKRLTYINVTNNVELLDKLIVDFSELKNCFEKCE